MADLLVERTYTRTELVWPGKRTQVDRVALPFQVVETINQSRATREQTPLMAGLPPLPLFEGGPGEKPWTNKLIWGENKYIMASLLQGDPSTGLEPLAGKVDLIYIDPPFATGQDFSYRARVGDEEWLKEASIIEETAYRDTWGRGLDSYLQMMYERLMLMRELLAEGGGIFVHIGSNVGHIVRSIMEEVFGESNFRNEIILPGRAVKNLQQQFQSISRLQIRHDILLWSTKSPEIRFAPHWIEKSDVGNVEGHWHHFWSNADRPTMRYELFGITPRAGQWVWKEERALKAVKNYERFQREAGGRTLAQYWRDTGSTLEFIRPSPNDGSPQYWREPAEFRIADSVWSGIPIYSNNYNFPTEKNERLLREVIDLSTKEGDLVADFFCVRKGTGVWVAPPVVPPHAGGQKHALPVYGEGQGGGTLVPIESLRPGDSVLAHDGQAHRVLRVLRRPYKGLMVGIQHHQSTATLWITADHRVFASKRPRSLGGNADWSAIPPSHRDRRKELRRDMTPPERKLWQVLRREALGVKFRRQHPIGPYIADFYSRDARLVVEVDGAAAHSGEEAIAYDQERDAFLSTVGLQVLRFPAVEVERNLEGVFEAVRMACARQNSPERAEWVRAADLLKGDIVFIGPERTSVRIDRLLQEFSEEEVYDLEVEGAHSYLTEVCAIHNCGSGTTIAVAEKLGRRWIGCDLSRYAIQVSRKRLLDIPDCQPFQVLNLGRYERRHWQVNVLNGPQDDGSKAIGDYLRFIVGLYRAEPVGGYAHLHGQKAGRWVHVGAADAPVTRAEIMETVRECQANRYTALDVLGWEWEMGLHDTVREEARRLGVDLRLLYIPREVMDKRAVQAGDVHFYELAYLKTALLQEGRTATVRLEDFIIPNPDLVPEEVRGKVKKWSDYIDFWAVDWDYRGDTFHNQWQMYRTRKNPTLRLISDPHIYSAAGSHHILVKVIDIFGNDTTQLLEVKAT